MHTCSLLGAPVTFPGLLTITDATAVVSKMVLSADWMPASPVYFLCVCT